MSHSSSMAFNSRQQRMWRRNQNTTQFRPSKTLGPVAHTVLVALMLAVLGLIYLTQITKTSTYGYQINELEIKQQELADRKQDLQIENDRLQALNRVQESNVAKALEQPASTEYAN
jgi:hypothetical protein